MKHSFIARVFALLLCAALLTATLPFSAFAESAAAVIEMVEGDVTPGFAPATASCTSTDPSVAWVDENGSLNALREGTTTVTVSTEDGTQAEYAVTVSDYTDGSEVVGNLKIIARYNDSMTFFDGHVYLLFTSYQDGVEFTVSDLYGAYEIDDQYYTDIREDISNGSNHTGSETEKYFYYAPDMSTVTLDRGQLVTIGMYRGFDLSVYQAAFGSLKNSSGWTNIVKAGKADVIENIFELLKSGRLNSDAAFDQIKKACAESGTDYTKLLDGVVEGGVCFNRELFNQKLEWDQYENVTYDLDITQNQLDVLQMYLNGNLNKFSMFKNSCATVALRAWNAAVGTRGGEPSAYYLTTAGEGIFSMIDAPKSVRDSIVSRLQGYYLNNAEGVAEPGAGYQDETGWVYVSAPKNVSPLSYVYDDDSVTIDMVSTSVCDLIRAANNGSSLPYQKEEQQIGIKINRTAQDEYTVINSIDFTVNDTTVSLDESVALEEGVWLQTAAEEPAAGNWYTVVDPQGNELMNYYDNGVLYFCIDAFPIAYRVGTVPAIEDILGLDITVFYEEEANAQTEIYVKNGEEKVFIDGSTPLNEGDKIYIKPIIPEDEEEYIVSYLNFGEDSLLNAAHYDAEEGAYFAIMPAESTGLTIIYEPAVVKATHAPVLQLQIGDTISVDDYAQLYVNEVEEQRETDTLCWEILNDPYDGAVDNDGKTLTALKYGGVYAWAYEASNKNVGVLYLIEVYDSFDDMAVIHMEDAADGSYTVSFSFPDDPDTYYHTLSGNYRVGKGAFVTVTPSQDNTKAVLAVLYNGKTLAAGEGFTLSEDTTIKVVFADAEVKGMPKSVTLADRDATYQLAPQVRYTGLLSLLPVYDGSITYESSDPLVAVDEHGLISLTGDLPQEGKLVYVTAYAGSCSKQVCAQTKVVVGDYQGERIVGKLTISARRVSKNSLVPHSAITFTSYEDLDLNVSYYDYYKPNDKYNDLMVDYELHPENYSSDPALWNDNELNLEDRESYFDIDTRGSGSEPAVISLKAGESFSASNYSFDPNNLETLYMALNGTGAMTSAQIRELVEQMRAYDEGEAIDGSAAFDNSLSTFGFIFQFTRMLGVNPADGSSVGGLMINREIYNQFRGNNSQFPNSCYTVEITADELANLQAYLANPDNNRYSLFVKNCSTSVVDLWNAATFDKPELHLTANLTGLGAEPMSMYAEVCALSLKPDADGESGFNFYPRTVRYLYLENGVIDLIDAIGEVTLNEESKAKIDEARTAYDALPADAKKKVTNYDVLTAAESAYAAHQLEADKAAFNEYKSTCIAAVDALAKPGDSELIQAFITDAKDMIANMEFVESLSLEKNKSYLDSAVLTAQVLIDFFRPGDKEFALLGDVDGDGDVTIVDATRIQRWLSDLPIDGTFDEAAADVDRDGEISVLDATYIQRYLADLSCPDGIGQPIA